MAEAAPVGGPSAPTPIRLDREAQLVVVGLVALAAFAVLRIVWARHSAGPFIHGDEATYLGHARYLVDGYGRSPDGHYAGYSLLLLPAAALTSAPLAFYRAALTTNVVLWAVTTGASFALVRRLYPDASRWVAVVAATAVALFPPTFTYGSVAMSENALASTTVGAAFMIAVIYGRPVSVTVVVGAAIAAYPSWANLRGVVVAVAFVVALVVGERAASVPRRIAVQGALVTVALVVAGVVFNAVVRPVSRTPGLSDETTPNLELLRPEHWPDWAAGVTARLAYLGAASGGLILIGLGVAGVWAAGREHERRTSAVRRGVGAFILTTVAGTVVAHAAALARLDALPRVDYLYYGRYSEAVALPAVAVGAAWLLVGQANARARLAVAVAIAGAMLVLTEAGERLEQAPRSPAVNIGNVIALVPMREWLGARSLPMYIAVAAGAAFVVIATSAVSRGAAVMIVLLAYATAAFVIDDRYVDPNVEGRAEQRVLVDAVAQMERLDVPVGCVTVPAGDAISSWHDRNYRFFLPRTDFTADRPRCPLVLTSQFQERLDAGEWLVAGENHAAAGLWVRPDALSPEARARVRDSGAVFVGGPCDFLPADAYRSAVTAEVDGNGLRIAVRHVGGGAPWLGTNTTITPAGCGRVALSARFAGGGVDPMRATGRVAIPRTVFPGEEILVSLPLPTGDPQRVTLELVQDGVTTFVEQGDEAHTLALPL